MASSSEEVGDGNCTSSGTGTNVFLTRELHVPLLNTNVRGVVSLNNLVQRDGELLPALFRVLPQLFDGREDDHSVLRGGIYIDHFTGRSPLELPDPSLQTVVLLYMFSFLAK